VTPDAIALLQPPLPHKYPCSCFWGSALRQACCLNPILWNPSNLFKKMISFPRHFQKKQRKSTILTGIYVFSA
jgi:hypothetical protein